MILDLEALKAAANRNTAEPATISRRLLAEIVAALEGQPYRLPTAAERNARILNALALNPKQER